MTTLPAGLVDKTWVTLEPAGLQYAVAGSLSGNNVLSLPRGERPLAASGGKVASGVFDTIGALGVSIIVRNVSDGTTVATHAFPSSWILPDGFTLTGQYCYFSMRPIAGQPATGVFRMSLADGAVESLIAPDTTRGQLLLSPSEGTLASPVVGSTDPSTDLLVLATGQRQRFHVTGSPILLSDSQIFSSDGSGLYAYAVNGGQLQWMSPTLRLARAYLTSDGSLIVAQVGFDIDAFSSLATDDVSDLPRVVVVDTPSGSVRAIRLGGSPLSAQYLWTQVSSDSVAILTSSGHYPEFDLLSGEGFVSTDLVDVQSGQSSAEPFVVVIPAATVAHP